MGSYINQFTEPPIDIPNNPIQEPQAENPKQESKSISKYLLIAVGLVILAVIVYFVFFSGSGQTNTDNNQIDNGQGNDNPGNNDEPANTIPDLSRNGICDTGENCYDYPTECRCAEGEVCPVDTKACTKPVCGNGKCESGEDIDNCCDDCGCATPECEVCNRQTHICQIPEANISDEAVTAAITKYYTDAGQAIENITVRGSTCTNSQKSRSAVVNFVGMDSPSLVRVTESGEVIVLPTN